MTTQTDRWIAAGLFAGLAVFAVYYPWRLLTSFVPFAFSGDTSWQTHSWVEDDVLVPFFTRLLEFLLWMPTIAATQGMIFAAMWLTFLIWRGAYFEPRTVRALQWVGGCAAIAGLTAIAALSIDAWMITQFNAPEHRATIRLRLDGGEVGVLLTGLGVFLLGWVLNVLVLKARENAEIV